MIRLLIVVGVALVAVVMCWYIKRVYRMSDETENRFREHAKWIVAEMLLDEARADGIRYELLVRDWGDEYGDMRFRWTIFDADRHTRAVRYVGEPDPQGVEGVEVPYMLGNAATRPLAEAQALAWLATRNAEKVVLS